MMMLPPTSGLQSNVAGRVVATANFPDPAPTWVDITGAISGSPLVLRLDPFDRANRAYVLTTAGLWYTANLQDNPPAWTNVLSMAEMQAATEAGASFSLGGAGHWIGGQMRLSPNDEGYVGLLVRGSSVWFGRASDAPGGAGTWTWTNVAPSPYRGSALWVSQQDPQRVYLLQVDEFPEAARLRVSTDGGVNWTAHSTVGFWDGVPFLFLPAASNEAEIFIGAVRNPTAGTGVFRSQMLMRR